MKLWYFPGFLTISLLYFWIPSSMCCNKALCASDVSKCLIQELCQCRPGEGNCSCCKECMLCLGTLWDECCDCVGMCNPRNYSDTPPTSKSTVEELHEPIASLFRALTDGDTNLSWKIVSFPVAEELSPHENLVSVLETVNHPQHHNVSVSNNVHPPYSSEKERICTVVYFDECLSIYQCKISCDSMGASKYRWFHNACCECIGPDCVDYGSKINLFKIILEERNSQLLNSVLQCLFPSPSDVGDTVKSTNPQFVSTAMHLSSEITSHSITWSSCFLGIRFMTIIDPGISVLNYDDCKSRHPCEWTQSHICFFAMIIKVNAAIIK